MLTSCRLLSLATVHNEQYYPHSDFVCRQCPQTVTRKQHHKSGAASKFPPSTSRSDSKDTPLPLSPLSLCRVGHAASGRARVVFRLKRYLRVGTGSRDRLSVCVTPTRQSRHSPTGSRASWNQRRGAELVCVVCGSSHIQKRSLPRAPAPPLRTVPVPFRPFRSSRSARSGDRSGAVLGSEAVWRNPGSCWAGASATKGLPHPSASWRAAQTVNNGVVIAGSRSRIARLIANKRFIWSGYIRQQMHPRLQSVSSGERAGNINIRL